MNARTIRVLVVDDSLSVRRRMAEVLEEDPELRVVGEASDGETAIRLCQELRPDVITLDMVLPGMTGVEVTEYIMAHQPTPILVVSSSANRGELIQTYDALSAGAVDVLDKCGATESVAGWERTLVSSLKIVSRIKVITHPRHRLRIATTSDVFAPPPPAIAPPAPPTELPRLGTVRAPNLLALGASTGGPGALVQVLRAIPTPLPVPILGVIHLGAPFGMGFPDWLATQIPHPVGKPRHGERLAAYVGQVVLAPPDQHLVLREGRIYLTNDPERFSCRPSVDVLFESIAQSSAQNTNVHTAAALLTGMGRDGAAGLLALRRAGGFTIAQDEATSVVYGMPREAVLMGAADRQLGLPLIGPALASLLKGVP